MTTFSFCPVFGCNRKYKTEERLQRHVENDHFYETRNSNIYFEFTLDEKRRIVKNAINYMNFIQSDVHVNDSRFIETSKRLFPQRKPSEVDLNRVIAAHHQFIERFLPIAQNIDWKRALRDFERFFQMGLPYYDTNFCPTIIVDFLWHATMQDSHFYKDLCQRSCQVIIPHCDIPRTNEEDEQRFEYYKQVYKNGFKNDVYIPDGKTFPLPSLLSEIEQHIVAREKDQQLAEQLRIQELERRRIELVEFCRAAELPQDTLSLNDWYTYLQYYKLGYKKGLRGNVLILYVKYERDKVRRDMRSSC